jgi:hypothetical protein
MALYWGRDDDLIPVITSFRHYVHKIAREKEVHRVSRYARSIDANGSKAANSIPVDPQKEKGFPNAQSCEPGAAGRRQSRRVHLGRA